MIRRSLWSVLPIAASLFALAACDNGGTVGVRNTSGNASLVVKLKDAPGNLDEAWVKVGNIQFIRADSLGQGGQVEDLTVTNDGWINLLALTDGNTADLFTGTLPAGAYTQVRLVVCDMYIRSGDQIIATPGAVLPDGVVPTAGTELKLTSQCRSGFKANLPKESIELDPANVNTLVIDFDARRSFAHQAGKSGKWIVTPVMFGTVSVQGHAMTGGIAGSVAVGAGVSDTTHCGATLLAADSLLKFFVPTATADTVFRTTKTTGTTYQFSNLPLGTYTMGNDPIGFANGDSLFYTAAAVPATVAVTLDHTSASNYTISAFSCKRHV